MNVKEDEWEIKLSVKFDNKPTIKLYKHFSEDDFDIFFMMSELCFDFLQHQHSFATPNYVKERFIKTIKEEF
tara:strand:- start:308 stop:523 length:216 start_codon:yes stop_codon:yes gene_type:complete